MTSHRPATAKASLVLFLWVLCSASVYADDSKDCLAVVEDLYYNKHFDDPDIVITACDRLLERPEQPKTKAGAHFSRGRAYHFGKKDYDRALADYGEAIALGLRTGRIYQLRGDAHQKNGNRVRAIEDYETALAIDSNNLAALYGVAHSYHDVGHYDDAIATFGKLITRFPKQSKYYLERGLARLAKGDDRMALQDVNRAIALDPENPEAYEARGELYEKNGDVARAQANFDKAIDLRADWY